LRPNTGKLNKNRYDTDMDQKEYEKCCPKGVRRDFAMGTYDSEGTFHRMVDTLVGTYGVAPDMAIARVKSWETAARRGVAGLRLRRTQRTRV
jgi:hypothetical protein